MQSAKEKTEKLRNSKMQNQFYGLFHYLSVFSHVDSAFFCYVEDDV